MQAVWEGHIVLGGIRVPVKLYAAVRPDQLKFNFVHRQDKVPLKQEMYCPSESAAIDHPQRVPGYEISRDQYIVINRDESDALAAESGNEIEIRDFVDPHEIDPRYFERFYYLGANGGEPQYLALLRALEQTGRVGICQWVMSHRSHLGALHFWRGILCLVVIRLSDEIIDSETLGLRAPDTGEPALEAARKLILKRSGEYSPQDYRNTFAPRLKELISRKAQNQKIPSCRIRGKKATRDRDLLANLEAGLNEGGDQ